MARRCFVNKQFTLSAHTMNGRAFKFNDMFIDCTTIADVDVKVSLFFCSKTCSSCSIYVYSTNFFPFTSHVSHRMIVYRCFLAIKFYKLLNVEFQSVKDLCEREDLHKVEHKFMCAALLKHDDKIQLYFYDEEIRFELSRSNAVTVKTLSSLTCC